MNCLNEPLIDFRDDAKNRGFIFVVDMRRGTSWDVVKPILKCLQVVFSF
jgi:hypothetical protein